MSASIDKEDSTDPGGGSRAVLASWLEAHAAGECDAQTMQTQFLEACRRHPEAPWDALALLDQYQRRGKLEPPLARTLKAEIAQMVFGVARDADGEAIPPRPAKASAPRPVQWQRPPAAPPPRPADPFADEDDEEDEEEIESAAPVTPPPPPRREEARPVAPAIVPTKADLHLPPTTIEVGSVLRDRYELQRVLGRGADGVVYRALDRNRRHLADGQRHVAVKVLRSDPTLTAEALIDVQRRAHQGQMLLHPHIARVYDFDHQGDVHFVVMEWVHGELLEMLLQSAQRFAIGRERALKLIGDVGAALAYAHEHGVIVGNLTPRKIMVTSGGDAKLIDVGFAASRAADDRAEDNRSQYDARYASLERVQGEPLTTSDDVYSLACIAYELLTGRHPYDGQSGAAARVQARKLDPVPSLATAQWQTLERALRVSRSDRDITVAQLVTALANTKGLPASPRSESINVEDRTSIRAERRQEQAQPPEKTSGSGARWLLALFVLAALGAAAWWFMPSQQREQLKENIADVAQATVNPKATRSEVDALPPSTAETSRALETGAPVPQSEPARDAAETLPQVPASSDVVEPTAAVAPAAEPPPAVTSDPKPANAPASGATNNGIIGFQKDTYVVRESDVVVRIPVTRTRSTRGEVRFRWTIQGNSAEAGADFAAVGPGSEQLAPGQASTVLHIPLVSDSRREGTEMFLVHLEDASGGARLGDLTRAAVIIVDDD